jgi:virginiamycin A acetyltransferase
MKNALKALGNSFATCVIIPLFILFWILRRFGNEDRSFWGISQFLSLFPGIFGNYFRKAFYCLAMTRCSQNCAILFGTIFSHVDTEIGEGVYIGPQCNIGKCKIEDHCTIGSGVHIMSGKKQHNFESSEIPIQEQGGRLEKIVIGENSWVGNCALIMANIGEKSIIDAGSVVTQDVTTYSVVAGNPAQLIRNRNKTL